MTISGIAVVDGLDIFGKVGRGVAHDEVVPFAVKNGIAKVGGESISLDGNKISVEFVKVSVDELHHSDKANIDIHCTMFWLSNIVAPVVSL